MKAIYYYEIRVKYIKGIKKLREHLVENWAVSSAETPEEILTGHTLDRLQRQYYGKKYNGKVQIEIAEILSKKKVGTQIRSKA